MSQVTPVASDITPLPGVTLNQIIGALANNGGPTQTHILVAGSPAINKGSNALIPTGVTTDQRGAGFPRIVNSIVDIGAVEVGSAPRYSLKVSKTGGLGLVTSNPAGINCGATCAANFTSGTLVKLTAKPDAGYVFTGWSGNCNGTAPTCDLTMNAAKNVNAGFARTPASYPLTLIKAGAGFGAVASSPAGINCGAACGFQVANFATNSTVVLTATGLAGSGTTFTGWSGCDSVNVALRQCTVKMSAARFVTANFARPLLTVRKTGSGLVVSNPVGIFCGSTCVAPYSPNTIVTLVAIPATGYGFGSWVGCAPKPGFPQQCTLTMGAVNKGVTANFIK